MRIIAGRLKGRHFDSPRTNRTHPMSDKIRGALFNALGELDGLTVLDAFAGSGALSFEAVSRGAATALAIEQDKEACQAITANIQKMELQDTVTLQRKNVKSWSRGNQDKQFDIVLADPPYNDIRPDLLQSLAWQAKPGGLFVVSWPGKVEPRRFNGVELIDAKTYGDAQLVFYRRTS